MNSSRRTGMVDVRHLPQQAAHWSGPAAVRMALTTRLGAASPSQLRLAQEECLGTDRASTVDRLLVATTLNDLMSTCRYTATDVDTPGMPQLATLQAGLVSSIDDGWPIVATLRMHDSGPRPPGYPDRPGGLEHTVLVFAYADGGGIARLADPASGGKGVGWADQVAPKYSLPTGTLLALMAGRGYVASGFQ